MSIYGAILPGAVRVPREGIFLSAKSIYRVIARLKARGVLREAVQPSRGDEVAPKAAAASPWAGGGPPGALVQGDTKQVPLGRGKAVYKFWAVGRPSSPMRGSEFLKEFGPTIAELKITHSVNRPNYPQGCGRGERSFRADEEEFFRVQELLADLGGLQAALRPGITSTRRCALTGLWDTRPQASSIGTGSSLIP